MREKIILSFLLIPFFCSSQNGKLSGKLILKDTENYKSVSENTFVILKTRKRVDSVKVDQNLNFVFNNVGTDTLKLSISPRTYPTNTFYLLCLKGNENKHIEIKYFSTCPYDKRKGNTCPICKKKDQVIPIVYGFLAGIEYKDKNGNPTHRNGKRIFKEEVEKITFKQGGCVVRDCQPNWFCQIDKLDF